MLTAKRPSSKKCEIEKSSDRGGTSDTDPMSEKRSIGSGPILVRGGR